jgi:hypothetical protein
LIHEVGVELQASLAAAGCAFPVKDGPERNRSATFARERIVIEYDQSGEDSFGSKHVARANPKAQFTCSMACKLTIYAQSPVGGSLEFEHKRRARLVVDMAIVALYEIATTRHNSIAFVSGRFVDPDDLKASEAVAGAVYELKFKFDRGIAKTTWKGAGAAEVIIGTDVEIANTTKVSAAGDPANSDLSTLPVDTETV